MKNAFERMGRRIVSLLMVVCLMLGMVGTAFAAESKKEQAENAFGMAMGSVIGGATIKDKVEATEAIAVGIIANYEAVYELAYGYAKESGYVDAAVVALAVAEYAMDDAIAYVEAQELDAEIKAMVLKELAETKVTIANVSGLLAADKFNSVDAAWETILSMKDEMHAHRDALAALALEVGLELDPYIMAMNDAIEAYVDMAEAIVDEVAAQIAACDEAYAAWVEEVGALADVVDPALGAAVRKFLTETPADTVAILRQYGEESLVKLFADAAVAYGDIADVLTVVAGVLENYGKEIYEAVEANPEVQALINDIKAQLEIALDEADKLYNSSVEAALASVLGQLEYLYENALPVVLNAVAEVDEEAALALDAALAALTEALSIACESAEGYLGWLADHAEAMGAALLVALLDNIDELLTTACPIIDQLIWNLIAQIEAAIPGIIDYLVDALIEFLPVADQWMYDWLYNNPEKVIAFFTEYGDELAVLAEEYGDEIACVLAYIAYTYGPEVLEFVVENPCEALDLFMKWYEKYGYRVWPMIDVYLAALGVYDAIDDQLNAANSQVAKLLAMLEGRIADLLEQVDGSIADILAQTEAHILAQIAALQAALEEAEGAVKEAILAEIAALEAALKAILVENITDEYFVVADSYYVALGDAVAYGPAADLLAAEMGMTKKYANLTIANATASDVLAALNAAEIAKADLITMGFGANAFTAAVAKDVVDLTFGEAATCDMDWTSLVGAEAAAAIEAALAELTAYVAEQVGDADVAALLTLVVADYAYRYISHLVDYIVVSEAIHDINDEALLVLVGMHNPMDGAVIDLNGETLDLGAYIDYLVTLTNVYSFVYALYADETIYVDAADVELAYDGSVMGVDTFFQDLMNMAYGVNNKFIPTAAGYEYIQEQIYNALNPTIVDVEDEEDEPCKHAFGGEQTIVWNWVETEKGWDCSAYYLCATCGEKIDVECTVNSVVTKQPTVEEEGEAVYTATVVIEGQTYTNDKVVSLAKLPVGPDTGDTVMVGLYVTMALLAAAAGVVVLKKKAA